MKRKNLAQITFSNEAESQYLPLSQIKLPTYQPRQYFAPESLKELALSIQKQGILEPLLVRRIDNSNTFELVSGGRRYRAAQIAELPEAPVRILELNDNQALEIAITENLLRDDLNPLEETESLLRLLSARLSLPLEDVPSLLYRLQNEIKGKLTDNVVGKLEKDIIHETFEGLMSLESFMTHRLRLLKLPQVIKDALRQGKIEYTKAIAIAKLKDFEQQIELLTEAINSNLSLREIKEKVKQLQSKTELDLPKMRVNKLVKSINKSKIWDKDPKKWQKIQGWLDKIENILENS